MPLRSALVALLCTPLLVGCDAWVGAEKQSEACPSEDSGPPDARLLTRREYRNTVFDLLGETEDPTTSFPSEPEVNGYNNNASSHIANRKLVESWLLAAESLATRARSRKLGGFFDCMNEDVSCAKESAKKFGRMAFRRPLAQDELDALVTVYSASRKMFGHDDGMEAMLVAILSAPQFLYRIEAPIEEKSVAESSARLLGPFELASRLSYFITGSLPDEELLAKAEHAQLSTDEEIASETQRLLKDPRAKEQMREFFRRWLGVSALELITRDGTDTGFGASLLDSLLRYTDSMLWSEESVSNLFTSPNVYLSEDLRKYFPDLVVDADGFGADATTRHGLLTQPALLALNAHPDQSSPIARGVFIRRRILCAPVSPPPPSVNNNPPDPDPNLTTRELFKVHTENPTCRACHELLDPLGFGLEAYDQLGRFRSSENGKPIDSSGELVETRDKDLDGTFGDASELSKKVSKSNSVLDCLASHLLTFGLGREPGASSECSRDSIVESHPMTRATLKEVIVAITTSYAFRYRQPLRAEDFPNEVTP